MCRVCFQGRYGEAEPVLERCQAIDEKALGPDHPDLASTLYSRAYLMVRQVSAIGIAGGGSLDRVKRHAWAVCDVVRAQQGRHGEAQSV